MTAIGYLQYRRNPCTTTRGISMKIVQMRWSTLEAKVYGAVYDFLLKKKKNVFLK